MPARFRNNPQHVVLVDAEVVVVLVVVVQQIKQGLLIGVLTVASRSAAVGCFANQADQIGYLRQQLFVVCWLAV